MKTLKLKECKISKKNIDLLLQNLIMYEAPNDPSKETSIEREVETPRELLGIDSPVKITRNSTIERTMETYLKIHTL